MTAPTPGPFGAQPPGYLQPHTYLQITQRLWLAGVNIHAHRCLLAERAHHFPLAGAGAAPLPAGAACLSTSAELDANAGSPAAAAAVTSATCGA